MPRRASTLFAASFALSAILVPAASHAAPGGAPSLLDVDTTARYACPDGGTCWGVVIAEGLQPVSEVNVSWNTTSAPGVFDAIVDSFGNLSLQLNLECGASEPATGVRALGTTSAGLSIESDLVDAPC
ncbi:hypothetical protein [Agromyces aerolatus]|uniref:hypothetical protein n=1 Tax=Agromyces sp. LY-1074 TaxID=3074080 RepID=UPI0028637E47|nr:MULTISPECIES: hypothetical protein [unclassified Agromyces]MDR5700187.1 hypothetical protein [Agromyces sp. LY-1074]MDR5706445.1 hypothetical protein [Agromyces sp. LY-1358]